MEVKYKSADELKSFYNKIVEKKRHSNEKVIKNYLQGSGAKLEKAELELRKLTTYSSLSRFNDIISIVNERKREFDDLYDDISSRLNVYIIGDDDLDKSALTNAILGNIIADKGYESDVTTINKYRSSNEFDKKVEIISANGDKVKLEVDVAVEYLNNLKLKIIESKELARKNYLMIRSEYINDENALNEAKNEFDKELLRLSSNVSEIIWPIEENEVLKKFVIVETKNLNETSIKSNYKADCVLYMIDTDKLYLQQDPNITHFIKSRKTIGVLSHIDELRNSAGDFGVEKLLKDVKSIYKNSLTSVVPISANDAINGIIDEDNELIESSGIRNLKLEMESHFHKNSREIKIKSKHLGAGILLSDLNNDVKECIKELRENDIKRVTLKSEFRQAAKKEASIVNVKVDWILSNYKMNTKSNIELKTKNLFDFGGDLETITAYVANEMFNTNEFVEELNRLKENIIMILQKFYSKNINNYRFTKYKYLLEKNLCFSEENFNPEKYSNSEKEIEFLSEFDASKFEIINMVELNLLLGTIREKSNFMMKFTKKKKTSNIQLEFNRMLEAITDELKNKLYSAIDGNINDLCTDVNKNIDDTFVELYCNPDDLAKAIRLLRELNISTIMPPVKISIKDIIFGKSKLSH